MVAEIPIDRPAYMHSFGMTERYLVLTEFPLVVNPLQLRFSARPFIENYRWEPERGLRFHVIDKESGAVVKTAEAAPCFAFHHVNAFERDGTLVVDLVRYSDSRVIQELYLRRLRSGQAVETAGILTRFEVPLRGDSPLVMQRPLASESIELPRIHYSKVAGKRYRFVWGTGDAGGHDFSSRLLKIDTADGAVTIWHEPRCYPGEPVFVPAPGANAEDEGVILSVVVDCNTSRSFLLVLDAATLSERARAEIPHMIPLP